MEQKLTAMQTIIEWCIKNAFNVEGQDGTKYIAIDYEDMKKEFDELLAKEKEQIVEAANWNAEGCGCGQCDYCVEFGKEVKTGEDYFTETFKQTQ